MKNIKNIYIKNAMIALINVLHSVIMESKAYLSDAENRSMETLLSALETQIKNVEKQIPRKQMNALESKTDFDYRLWVESQRVKTINMPLFEAEYKDLIKKYS